MRPLHPRLCLGLALLTWLALPLTAEVRHPPEWDLPVGDVVNPDPEPPWSPILQAAQESALLTCPTPNLGHLLPEPGRHAVARAVWLEAHVPAHRSARWSSLLILHQRRNE